MKARNGSATANLGPKSEGLSSFDFREHNVESLALSVIGQTCSGEEVYLFLVGWKLARVELKLGCCCPKRPAVTARKAFPSPWTGCDKGEEMW